MWFWLLMIALTVLSLSGAVFRQYFWWSMIGSGVLVTFGTLIEIVCYWRQGVASSREWNKNAVDGDSADRSGVQIPPKGSRTRTGDDGVGLPVISVDELSSRNLTSSP